MDRVQLSWSGYTAFVIFAVLLVVAPGPDLAVTMKNSLVGGRTAGLWTALGINVSNVVQGSIAAAGLGAIIVASQPVFETIRWAGIAYLCWLGLQALRSAYRGPGEVVGDTTSGTAPVSRRRRFLQGVLSNITNPKVLVFYLSVLPQFLPAHATVLDALALANTLPVIGLTWTVLVVLGVHAMRGWLTRRRVRRSLDATTGLVLFGFAGKLATDAA